MLKDAASSAESMIMASWLADFQQQQHTFGSPALFFEMQLREALAATASAEGQPENFRTACVCEVLARLPPISGSLSGLLQLLRSELLRAIYVDVGMLRARQDNVLDAQALVGCRTFFSECSALRRQNQELQEQLHNWQRTKQELMREADGRNELLRLAGDTPLQVHYQPLWNA